MKTKTKTVAASNLKPGMILVWPEFNSLPRTVRSVTRMTSPWNGAFWLVRTTCDNSLYYYKVNGKIERQTILLPETAPVK